MKKDRLKWNRRHMQRPAAEDPSKIVAEYASLAEPGRALDIAAGLGKNALYLAQNGFTVEAVDISDAALARYAHAHPNLFAVCADLDTFDIAPGRYDLILNIRFLHRRLFHQIIDALAPGGMLIFETWIRHPEDPSQGPACKDYLLRENELLHAFLPLRIVHYRESHQVEGGRPALMASLVGIR
ncbi:MAG: class I SAM-dependent methyltransferase [Desulfobacterales bacterium]|nr:class I SAM-dependent methyltransferase [Desulfobacterales bacterium]